MNYKNIEILKMLYLLYILFLNMFFECSNRKGLDEEDVKNVKARDLTPVKFEIFQKNWEAELERIEKLKKQQRLDKKSSAKVGDLK